MIKVNQIGLYIHFPWCIKKCPYCDFNSHRATPKNDHDLYISNLISDFKTHHLTHSYNKRICSIFLGGGTPSLFSASNIEKLLNELSKLCTFADEIEITLEANPGTIERDSFKAYKSAGINRVSLGVQSFQDKQLKYLGRIHSSSAAISAIEDIHSANITNFNIDIMHGLPEQTVSEAIDDLESALSLSSTHLSWYQLTLEPNTLFYHQKPNLPNEMILEDIEINGKQLLQDKGFLQYEVSAYSLGIKHQSLHNKNYWLFGDYIGIGAGAHSKITDGNTGLITRLWKHKQPRVYQQTPNSFIEGTEILSSTDTRYEFMLNALRLKNGFNLKDFEQTTGMRERDISDGLLQAQNKKLITVQDNHIMPTELGYNYLNDTIRIFE
ncbi:MAG: putative oxygen-independent coproporphyrinogen III oxidase [Francisellaceae bacterium]|jgi:putative oxygen-independent coproporphyrinogen III oxidase